MGNRYTANIDEPTTLSFDLFKDESRFDAFEITSVVIYPTYEDAESDTNSLYTITSTGISHIGLGFYEYTVPAQPIGRYFDKVSLLPTSTGLTRTYINNYNVGESIYRVDVGPPVCSVYGKVLDAQGLPSPDIKVKFIPDINPAVESYSSNGVLPFPVDAVTDDEGYFSVDLIQTVIYRVVIKQMGLYNRVKVPDKQRVELWSLTSVEITGDIPDYGGESGDNW